jgi:hypothetical protein
MLAHNARVPQERIDRTRIAMEAIVEKSVYLMSAGGQSFSAMAGRDNEWGSTRGTMRCSGMLITHKKLVRASMMVSGCRGEEKGSKKEESPPPAVVVILWTF